MKNKLYWNTLELEMLDIRSCDHYSCDQAGEFPAPKCPENLKEKYYFCINHIRDYNENWNYFAGIKGEGASSNSESSKRKFDFAGFYHASTHDPHNIFQDSSFDNQNPKGQYFSPKTEEGKAFVLLELSWPFMESDLKKSYKTLAKQHHPDLNPNDADAIVKFREIKEAYELLKGLLESVACS